MGEEKDYDLNHMVRMEAIFTQREANFTKRETLLKDRSAALEQLQIQLEQKKAELKKEFDDLVAKRANLIQEKEDLDKEKEEFRQSVEEHNKNQRDEKLQMQRERAELARQHEELVVQKELELQEIKNERYDLQLEKEKLQAETGYVKLGLQQKDFYMLKTEHERLLQKLEEEKEAWERKYNQAVEDYEQQIEILNAEKQNLIHQVLQSVQHTDSSKATINEGENEDRQLLGESEETGEAGEPVDQKRGEEILEDYDDENIYQEELTASVIEQALRKSTEEFTDVEILHSEYGDQVAAQRRALSYRFVIAHPSYFDIYTERRYSRTLERNLQKLNEKHPSLKFSYDKRDQIVIITGYFTNDMPMNELIDYVMEASAFIKS